MGAVHLVLMALDLASTGPPGTPLNRKSCSSSQLSIVARRNLNVSTGRSYMVLLPKKPGTATVDAFRPICLQNCSIKIAANSLTTKLQAEISSMIDLDQTGFLKGRSISKKIVYAMELVQVCHKREVPTIVLKLDFAKAFDTVNWEALMTILSARGFRPLWCRWVLDLLASSKSAVLVNGCPGPWIECRRGLRQGDPMSPYLFLLVADVLQTLIKTDGGGPSPDPRGW